MSKRALILLNLALATALAMIVLGAVMASGGPKLKYADFAAAAFTPVEYSTHNHATSVCGAQVKHKTGADQFQGGAENQSDLDADHTGSYLESVQLPQGVKVKKLSFFVQDFDADDAHLFLVRKFIKGNLTPRFGGYQVMGKTKSSGAVNDTMRKFTDKTIAGGVIDNKRYFYFLEMVVCANVEPFTAQIGYQ
jgi:hypothetical protein